MLTKSAGNKVRYLLFLFNRLIFYAGIMRENFTVDDERLGHTKVTKAFIVNVNWSVDQ